MPKKPKPSINESPDFETALKQLQDIVSRMENEQQSLEASIADYEQGTQLAGQCQQLLDNAQLKVEQLVKTQQGLKFRNLENESDA